MNQVRNFFVLLLAPAIALAQTNTFPTSGSVGIGTTTPGRKVEIAGTGSGEPVVRLNRGSNTDNGLIMFSTGGTEDWLAGEWGNNSDYQLYSYGLSAAAVTVLRASGNVGIGTMSPNSTLDVYAGSTGGNLRLSSATPTSYGELIFSSNNGLYLTYGSSIEGTGEGVGLNVGNLVFKTGYGGVRTERMRLTGAGNVGIGTTSPGARLEVTGSTNGYQNTLNLSNTSAGTAAINRIQLGNDASPGTGQIVVYGSQHSTRPNYVNIENAGPYPLLFGTNDTERVRIDSFGNVGIGTSNPTQKLSVNGSIRAKEVIVDTGWSDYVFKPDYRLASLSEVEGAIKRDGHLPGIPSAQEVAEHGVSIGEMQSRLLAKVEELTLHVIAQEKRLQKLETENAALRAGHTISPILLMNHKDTETRSSAAKAEDQAPPCASVSPR